MIQVQLQHQNVVGLIGVVTVGHPKLLVMQLCSKGSLLAVLQQASMTLLGQGARQVFGKMEGYCVGVAQGMAHLASQRLVQ